MPSPEGPPATAPGGSADRVRALTEAGEALRARPLGEVLEIVGEACRRWRGPDPDRETGEVALAAHYGVPRRSISEILDVAFATWTADSLRDWVAVELGDPAVLDGFVRLGGARRRAFGPRLAVFLAARGIPTTPVADLVSALCVKAPAWLKPPAGGDDLAARFAATLARCDPRLGMAILVEGWERGSSRSREAMEAADLVVATGGVEVVSEIRRQVEPDVRLVLHGPRLSAAIVLREALGANTAETVERLARDAAFAGQMGCLSPVVAYVEGSRAEAEGLLEPLHGTCVARWPGPPREGSGLAERAAFADWRATAELERATGAAGPWCGDLESPWTLQLRWLPTPPDPPRVPRLLVVVPVDDAVLAVEQCGLRRGTVATVGVAGSELRLPAVVKALAEAGAERVCPLGTMQLPPVAWRRDGRTTLGDLVRWVDWEC